jgi:hypothetical protein
MKMLQFLLRKEVFSKKVMISNSMNYFRLLREAKNGLANWKHGKDKKQALRI